MLSSLKPTARARVSRVSSYVVGVVFILVIAIFADWPVILKQFANGEVAAKMWPTVITVALVNTLWYTLASFVGGSLLGVLMAVMKNAGGPLSWFAIAFIEFFRGIPALLTIFGMAYILPIAFGVKIPGGSIGAGILGLILVTGAYSAEIIRSGIEAVPYGQREAARSLGMNPGQTMFWVVLPQGLRIVIPPMTNEFVMLLKDTSLLFIAGATVFSKELTNYARDALTTYASPTPLIVVAFLYLIVTLPLTWLVGLLEKKLDPKR
jgi:polar amino acid transport system permease protein